MNTKEIGELTEAIILSELLKRGLIVSKPWGDSSRYDFIVDIKNKLIRLQCKTGRISDGCVLFSSSSKGRDYQKDYNGQIDYFIVHVKELNKIYMIHVAEASNSSVVLRISIPQNNQISGVKWAEFYELDSILKRL